MKWFDKLIGKKAAEEVTDDTVTSTSEDERRAILEKEKQEAERQELGAATFHGAPRCHNPARGDISPPLTGG